MADKKSTVKEPSKVAAARARAVEKAQVAKEKSSAVRGAGTKHASGFTTFVREQGVVGLAVGLAIGASAGAAVKAIVDNFINPIVGFIIGGTDLSDLKWHVISIGDDRNLTLGWGAILSAVITLLATAFVIYQLVHIAKLDRLDKKKD